MIKRESQFGLLFRAWWRSTRMPGAFELKDSHGKETLPFSEVRSEQIDSGMANESKRGNLVRVQSGTAGTADYIGLVEYPSYIVIRYPKGFAIISVAKYLHEFETSKSRSLSQERAKLISKLFVSLDK